MNRRYGYFTIACLGLSSLIACHSSTAPTSTSSTTSTPATATAASTTPEAVTIAVAPATPGFVGATEFTAAGQSAQLIATETLPDDTQHDVTNQAAWASSDLTIMTISPTGVVTSVAIGQATISATFLGISGTTIANFAVNLTGTWSGTGTDSTGTSQFTAVLTQSGTTVISVSGPVTFVSNGVSGTGTFAATLTPHSTRVPFAITGSETIGGQTCTLAISGTAQAPHGMFTAPYAGSNSCLGPISGGQLALTLQ